MNFIESVVILILLLIFLFFFLTLAGSFFGAYFGAPFVPTSKKILRKMIKMAEIKKSDKVFDLGCGDGRIVFEAEKYSDSCIGIEISPPIIILAYLRKLFCRKKSEIRLGNIFTQKDIDSADVIFTFLFPKMMEKFYKEIFPKLKKGTKIVSHAFRIKELKPKKQLLRKETRHAPIFLFEK